MLETGARLATEEDAAGSQKQPRKTADNRHGGARRDVSGQVLAVD